MERKKSGVMSVPEKRRDITKKAKKRKKDNVQIQVRRRQSRRRRRAISTSPLADTIYKLLLIGTIIAALAFMSTVFFEVKEIEIRGNSKYTEMEIIAAANVPKGEKLFYISGFETSKNVFEKLPYVDRVRIKRRPPSKLIVEVEETVASVALHHGGMTYLIDNKCKLLEFFPTNNRQGYPIIQCSAVISPQPGKTVAFEEEYMLKSVKDVIEHLLSDEIATKVTKINIEKLYDVTFMYENRIKVYLGDTTDLAKKIRYLKKVLEDIGLDEKGTINIKNTERTIYRPSTAGAE